MNISQTNHLRSNSVETENCINGAGAQWLNHGLKTNTTLTELNLSSEYKKGSNINNLWQKFVHNQQKTKFRQVV